MTITLHEDLQAAFDWFNTRLFSDELPGCIITVQQLRGSVYGYMCTARFRNRLNPESYIDEIALSHFSFQGRTDMEILSTLVHEQSHVWQTHMGEKLPRKGYHNKEWANYMVCLGLGPSDTGRPGGKMTGMKMSHFIIPDGRFENSARELISSGFSIGWESYDMGEEKKPAKKKIKLLCPLCDVKVWANEMVSVRCENCKSILEKEEKDDDDDLQGNMKFTPEPTLL